jgi:hypothetical protein
MVAQTSFAGNRVFHPSTFGVLPAAERLAQARKALRDLAREQRKRARHAAEVAKLCPIFPAWPVPVAHVESRSRPGEFYTIDLEAIRGTVRAHQPDGHTYTYIHCCDVFPFGTQAEAQDFIDDLRATHGGEEVAHGG